MNETVILKIIQYVCRSSVNNVFEGKAIFLSDFF